MTYRTFSPAFLAAHNCRLVAERRLADWSNQLKALGAGSGPNGLTPDAIKFSPAYRSIKRMVDWSFRELQAANKAIVKNHKKENAEYHAYWRAMKRAA